MYYIKILCYISKVSQLRGAQVAFVREIHKREFDWGDSAAGFSAGGNLPRRSDTLEATSKRSFLKMALWLNKVANIHRNVWGEATLDV